MTNQNGPNPKSSNIKKNSTILCFKFSNLKSRLPILQWLPHYKISDFQADLIAGFTVGLTVIPQGLAYADLAGLPVQYGLYSSFMGSFLFLGLEIKGKKRKQCQRCSLQALFKYPYHHHSLHSQIFLQHPQCYHFSFSPNLSSYSNVLPPEKAPQKNPTTIWSASHPENEPD